MERPVVAVIKNLYFRHFIMQESSGETHLLSLSFIFLFPLLFRNINLFTFLMFNVSNELRGSFKTNRISQE